MLKIICAAIWMAISTASAVADGEMGSGNWDHMMSGGFMMILLWIGLIVLAIVIIRWLFQRQARNASDGGSSSATEILDQRFAAGEIDKEEYEERRRMLKNQG